MSVACQIFFSYLMSAMVMGLPSIQSLKEVRSSLSMGRCMNMTIAPSSILWIFLRWASTLDTKASSEARNSGWWTQQCLSFIMFPGGAECGVNIFLLNFHKKLSFSVCRKNNYLKCPVYRALLYSNHPISCVINRVRRTGRFTAINIFKHPVPATTTFLCCCVKRFNPLWKVIDCWICIQKWLSFFIFGKSFGWWYVTSRLHLISHTLVKGWSCCFIMTLNTVHGLHIYMSI